MRSLLGQLWSLPPARPAEALPLAARLGLPPVAAACVLRRVGPAAADAFLAPAWGHLHDPYAMRGMDIAVERVRRAVRDGEAVRIVTDYDVDGTTSSLILQGVLRRLGGGARLSYHIPDRFDEGYGLSVRAAEKAAADGVGLLLTADIGVRDHAAVAAARAGGVDVLVLDHHLPSGESVPADALAVLCPPQEGCPYPNRALAACGVSFKLAQALLAEDPRRDELLRSLLKMAAIGTVADVVDLAPLENRAIVALGLEALSAGGHQPGLAALLAVAGLEGRALTASDLGFRIGPRINAAGRLESASAVISLFDTRDPAEARARAEQLDALNRQRQSIQDALVDEVLRGVGDAPRPFVVAAGPEAEGWHRGVVGIVAARVRDRVHRPAAVVAVNGELATGSVRSVPGVHAVQALDTCADFLVRYGGHPVAAGFTVRTADLGRLQERLDAAVQAAGEGALVPTLDLDAECPLGALDLGLAEALARLEPHGKGNPAPRLWVPGVRAGDLRSVGERHLGFRAGALDAVWWGGRAHQDALRAGPVDLAGTLGFNVWNGRRTLRFTVEDARPAAG